MDLSALSPSRINTFKDCEFKYFITYHLRLPEARESNIYGIKGTAAHEALEYYANAVKGDEKDASLDYTQVLKDFYTKTELWKLDDGIRKGKGFTHPVNKYCEGCKWGTKDSLCSIAQISFKDVEGCPKPNFEEDLTLVEKAIKSKDYPLFKRKIIGTEIRYDLWIPEDEDCDYPIRLRGVIDLVTEIDKDTIEITDHKTGRAKSYNAALSDPQLRTYKLVARILWPQYSLILSSLYFLKKDVVTCIFSDEDDRQTLKALRRHWKSISENENPYRPDRAFWLCNYCVGHDRCGLVKDNHTRKGRLMLPVIECGYNKQRGFECWGPLKAENPNEVGAFNTHEMTYACEGHFEIHQGGEYKASSKEDVDG